MARSEWVGVAAIAALGYILLKKLEPVINAAQTTTNTVTTYVEKVTEKVEKVSESSSILKDTAEKYYTAEGIAYNLGSKAGADSTLTAEDKAAANTVLDNADKVNAYALATTPAVDYGVDAALAYAQGVVDASKTSSNKYSSAAGSSKQSGYVKEQLAGGTGAPYVQPTATAIKTAVEEYNIITGEKRSSGSSGSSSASTKAPSSVKVGSGYSAAKDADTTVNKGKYETVKVKK